MAEINETVRIAICDDSPMDRQILSEFLKEYLKTNKIAAVIDQYVSGESFLNSDTSVYHLTFLDILMKGINGMETAYKIVEENTKMQIVFCSTSPEFAAESYEVSALHYLVKPLEKAKLFRVLDRFFDVQQSMETMMVKVGREEELVFLNDILYVEADNKRSIFHTKKGDIHSSMSLAQACQTLTPPNFVRPIRYAVVSMKEVTAIPTDVMTLSDGTEISISRKERQRIRDEFIQYKWKDFHSHKA